jgi:hypothetical protein
VIIFTVVRDVFAVLGVIYVITHAWEVYEDRAERRRSGVPRKWLAETMAAISPADLGAHLCDIPVALPSDPPRPAPRHRQQRRDDAAFNRITADLSDIPVADITRAYTDNPKEQS